MLSFACTCGNVTLSIEPKQLQSPAVRWSNPVMGVGKMTIKYNTLTVNTQVGKWTLVKCNCCSVECCLISRGDVIVNPVLKDTTTARERLTYSQTFGLYVDLQGLKSRPTTAQNSYVGATSIGSARDQADKELIPVRQKKVELLYQEKERRIREFVMEQEEAYEAERQQINNELEAIKFKLENVHDELPKINITPSKTKSTKSSNDIFDMDEDIDDTVTLMEPVEATDEDTEESKQKEEEEEDCMKNDIFTSAALNIHKTEPVKLKDDFPSTFKEYVCA